MRDNEVGVLVLSLVLVAGIVAVIVRGIKRHATALQIADEALFIAPGLLVCLGQLVPHSTPVVVGGAVLIVFRIVWKARRRGRR